MPLYEYRCVDCQEQFEALRPMKDADESIGCPACDGLKTKRTLAVFYAQSGGRVLAGSQPNCTACSAQSCSSCGR